MEKRYRAVGLAIAVMVSFSAWSASSSSKSSIVRNSSYEAAGERVLRHEVIVPAAVPDVWHALTSSEGLRTWAAPVVDFELKTGGKFYSSYQPNGSTSGPGAIHNIVLSYVPLKMLTFKIGLTEAFPEGPRQAGTLFAVAELEPFERNKTRVMLSMVGFGTGSDWDKVYNFFDRNNPVAMANLRDSFIAGPKNWNRAEAIRKGAK